MNKMILKNIALDIVIQKLYSYFIAFLVTIQNIIIINILFWFGFIVYALCKAMNKHLFYITISMDAIN